MSLLGALQDKQFWRDVGSNSRDLAQSASNSAASNVTAPVDGIAWLLRKAGVNVPDAPLGGSDWAKNAGLLREVPDSPASVAGDTLGMIAPMLMAAKAPEIARGLLRGADNMMARKTLDPQTGAIVWHGSPHKFDKFDASKIGTGEGAQAYGHGLYLAESPDVAGQYAKILGTETQYKGNPLVSRKGELVGSTGNSYLDDYLHAAEGSPTKARSDLLEASRYVKSGNPEGAKEYQQALADLRKVRGDITQTATGQTYKVDLPDDQIAKMLDWDKPLSQQSPEVQKTLSNLVDDNGYDALHTLKNGYGANFQNSLGQEILHTLEKNYAVTGGKPSAASEYLKNKGIPGIRYLDGGSRGSGVGTSNYVVFPGNEGLLNILERNGVGP
jgi:hypothetical protein